MRWFAFGDPQTSLERLKAVLDAHGLLDQGALKAEVGLVSVGDHFDYAGDAGEDGAAVLRWLTEHDPAQVVVLVGNHDLARVQELAPFDDATFARAKARALEVQAGQCDEDTFLAEHALPTSECARRDLSGFRVEQRALVESLLRAGRLRLAVSAVLDGGAPVLVTHASISQREADFVGASDAEGLARELNAFFDARIEAWPGGETPLDLTPLHQHGLPGREGGGMLYHRASEGEAESPAALTGPFRRRYPAWELPPALIQACGHVQHEKSMKMLGRFVSPEARELPPGAIRALTVRGDEVVYGPPPATLSAGDTALLLIDGKMNDRAMPPGDFALLPLARLGAP